MFAIKRIKGPLLELLYNVVIRVEDFNPVKRWTACTLLVKLVKEVWRATRARSFTSPGRGQGRGESSRAEPILAEPKPDVMRCLRGGCLTLR
jgi:hypothetical protein